MKKILFLIFMLLSLQPMSAVVQLDSLSYATGYQFALAFLAGNNPYITNEDESREFVRGIEENMPDPELLRDSTFIVNYNLGGMQGVFLADAWEHTAKDEQPLVKCVIDGLRKVADNQLTLPRDTIEILEYMRSLPDSTLLNQLPEEQQCKFYTSYGILKGLSPGLRLYLDEYGFSNIEVSHSYFAQGMADVLLAMTSPEDAYELGRLVARSMYNIQSDKMNESPNVFSPEFLSGIKAALWLEPTIMTWEEVERINQEYMVSRSDLVVTECSGDIIVPLIVSPGALYSVDWDFIAYMPAKRQTCSDDVLSVIDRIRYFLLSEEVEFVAEDGSLLLYRLGNGTSTISISLLEQLIDTANSEIDFITSDYKFICGRVGDDQVIFGVVDTAGRFYSHISEAVLNIREGDDGCDRYIEFKFGDGSDKITKANEWADFTRRNIGNTVLCELNGRVTMAPRINTEITGGACAISGLSISRINDLFSEVVILEEP